MQIANKDESDAHRMRFANVMHVKCIYIYIYIYICVYTYNQQS